MSTASRVPKQIDTRRDEKSLFSRTCVRAIGNSPSNDLDAYERMEFV